MAPRCAGSRGRGIDAVGEQFARIAETLTRPKSGTRVVRNCMNLVLKSSPGFREKLAEREEAISPCRVLFHIGSFRILNICTIEIRSSIRDLQLPI